MGLRALIYIQSGTVAAAKQTTACLRWAMDHGYQFSIVRAGAWMEAVRLIREGDADILLLAYAGGEAAAQIIAAVEAVGGRVETCRGGHRAPAPKPLLEPGHTTDELVINAAKRGFGPDQIHAFLGVPLERIRLILRRRGSNREGSDE